MVIGSSLIIIGLLLAFYLSKNLNYKISQEGFSTSANSNNLLARSDNTDGKEIIKEMRITFDSLIFNEPNAPVKVMGMGSFYARAKSAISIDAHTHTILHYQNGKERIAIASLTKIMTAIIVIEKIEDLENEYVTIDEEVIYTDGTKIGCPRSGYCISNRLQLGEEVSVQYLLEAMLMNSANDAAVALAKYVAGSQEEFAKMMNKKARELGLVDTHFCNPSGLDDENNPGRCYSSAYDIARIAAYSLQYDNIWGIMKVKEKDIYSKDKLIMHHIINTDILIDQIPNCLGGKTGFTYEAGKSLMMAAHHPQDRNKTIVAVLLDDVYRWEDMRDLISWSFQAYNWPEEIF